MLQIINEVDDVGNLCKLLELKHVLRLIDVTVFTNGGNGTEKVTINSPKLHLCLDGDWRSTLVNGSKIFGPETKLARFTIHVAETTGSKIFRDTWYVFGDKKKPGGIRNIASIEEIVSLPLKSDQIVDQFGRTPKWAVVNSQMGRICRKFLRQI